VRAAPADASRRICRRRLAAELLPPRLRLAVVHHEIRIAQVARCAERQRAPLDAPVERDRRVAQWTERHRNRDACDHVVHDLVPGEDLERIRARPPRQREHDHGLARPQKADLGDPDEARTVERGDTVLPGTAGLELA